MVWLRRVCALLSYVLRVLEQIERIPHNLEGKKTLWKKKVKDNKLHLPSYGQFRGREACFSKCFSWKLLRRPHWVHLQRKNCCFKVRSQVKISEEKDRHCYDSSVAYVVDWDDGLAHRPSSFWPSSRPIYRTAFAIANTPAVLLVARRLNTFL